MSDNTPRHDETVATLHGLTARLLAIDSEDREAIVELGSGLEEVAGQIESPAASELAGVALQALQAVYEGSLGQNAAAALESTAEALAAITDLLARGDDDADASAAVSGSAGRLRNLLAGKSEPASQSPAPAQTDQAAASAPVETPPASLPAAEKAAKPAPAEPQRQAPAASASGLATTLPQDADIDLLGEYIVECLDHITAAEACLLELEEHPTDGEQIHTIFRAFHTIKGSSGFLGLDAIQRVAHLAENLLDRARNGQIAISGGYADLALKSCDALRSMIETLEGVAPGGPLTIPAHLGDLLEQLTSPEACGINGETPPEAEEMRVGDILVGRGQADREAVEQAARSQSEKPIGQTLVAENVAAVGDVAAALRTQKKLRGQAGDATIRVGTDRLDNLINMVGELVISQSMVVQDPAIAAAHSPRLSRNVARVGKIVRELQDLTMSLRMVPLSGLFQKMARLVRDLSHKAGKNVRFATEGEETEIDRNMVEVISDPLIHMIRNAVDHGLETPAQRRQVGKDECGTVTLRAYHSAGHVIIELRDDGAGLNRQRIVAKAVQRGIIEAGRELSDSEAFALIFQPGFSTAEKITDVSGRGVGMDVVKRNIESLRGRVDVTSREGEGSVFTTRVPLTMAIADAMLLRVGAERYLLPTASIRHSFRPVAGAVSTITGRGEVVMLRQQLLPVFRLHELFDVHGAVTDPLLGLLIVIESEAGRCALLVDELLGQQQVVIKTLGGAVKHAAGVAGGSILGDGRVGLILDAAGLLELATARNAQQGTCAAVA